MKTINKYLILFFAIAAFSACDTGFDDQVYSSGDMNLSNYVAVGNSLTAGFADAALYRSGQVNSYPAMIAQRFQMAGGGAFTQPLCGSEIGLGASGNAKKILALLYDSCTMEVGLSPVDAAPSGDLSVLIPVGSQGPFNNMGIPGAKSFHLITPNYASLNPLYGRFSTSTDPAHTVMDDVKNQSPTFFTSWIGNNDVLGYALAGGEGMVGGTAPEDITAQLMFDGAITSVIADLLASASGGIIANIPNVTDIPFFNTIPYNPIVLTRQGQVDTLNFIYASNPNVNFQLGQNPLVIETDNLGQPRQMVAGELVLLSLPLSDIRCNNVGTAIPVPKEFVLDASELTEIKNATTNFNNSLKNIADMNDLAYADMNAFFKNFANNGFIFNGVDYTVDFIEGGAFSLDGIHATPRGYAIIANEFIRVMNDHYNASVPQIDINSKDGIIFP